MWLSGSADLQHVFLGALSMEFLREGLETDNLKASKQAESSKQQPLPSAASIRPLLMKASALLANVRLHAVCALCQMGHVCQLH